MEGDTLQFRTRSRASEISIHSLRMEGDVEVFPFVRRNCISIHSLRMEGDRLNPGMVFQQEDFNPLPPHGGRLYGLDTAIRGMRFQSTPSAWRETSKVSRIPNDRLISIHSLRMEGDLIHTRQKKPSLYFNPLPPHGGRHTISEKCNFFAVISIHSLRMEGDILTLPIDFQSGYFNPLPPHGGRLSCCRSDSLEQAISIHSLRMEGDNSRPGNLPGRSISIHSLRMEGDSLLDRRVVCDRIFQSTPSAWRETDVRIIAGIVFRISIHSLRMEGDNFTFFTILFENHFNPLPPHGGRQRTG